ncbi:hypothetical protein [Pseudoxanthomonas dokdonensis]|nr:hypothetical protein [Pseudoxanthomonas dokdonensis]
MNASEQSALSVTILVSLPVFAVIGSASLAVEPSVKAIDDSLSAPDPTGPERKTATRAATEPPATMQVVEVTRTAEGNRQVILQGIADNAEPEQAQAAAEYKASLTWPALDIDPSTDYKAGEIVHFSASKGGSGWLIRNAAQQVIGFIPNAAIQSQAFSERW